MFNSRALKPISFALGLGLAMPSLAADFMQGMFKRADDSRLQYQLRAGYGAGGDSIGPKVDDAYAQDQVSAGNGLMFGAGVRYALSPALPLTAMPLFVESNINIMIDAAHSSETDVSFIRYPFDVLLGTEYKQWRFAAGYTRHINPKLEIQYSEDDNGFDKETTYEKTYNDADGQVVEVSYGLGKIDANIRYTQIEYDFAGVKVDGSGVALSVMLRF